MLEENIVDKLTIKNDTVLNKKVMYMQDIDGITVSDVIREAIDLRYALIKRDKLRSVNALLIREID